MFLNEMTYSFPVKAITRQSGFFGFTPDMSMPAGSLVAPSQTNFVVNIKVFLQGAYNTSLGVMNTALNTPSLHLIPQNQPYAMPPSGSSFVFPYLYTEKEQASPQFFISNSNLIIDWILVELRTNQYAESTVARRVGFLLKTGAIVDLDGISPLNFQSVNPSMAYHIVIRHRNHLSVMTSVPIVCAGICDFTNNLELYYGKDAFFILSNGVYAMYAGDVNQNGTIDDSDKLVWTSQNGIRSYLNADCNLDSRVTAGDLNSFILVNTGKKSNVPEFLN